jgi:hypothetical protein
VHCFVDSAKAATAQHLPNCKLVAEADIPAQLRCSAAA